MSTLDNTFTFETHDNFTQKLNHITPNLQVGDIILWGFDHTFLTEVLFRDSLPPYSPLQSLIGYATTPYNREWSKVVSHSAIIAGFDPEKTGAASIIVIEAGIDRHSGWNGLMKHPLLYYCSPDSTRYMKIVRYGKTPEDPIKRQKNAEIYQLAMDRVVQNLPFLSPNTVEKYLTHRPKLNENDNTVPPIGDDTLQVGLSYNNFQLLQYASAVTQANTHDDVFRGLIKYITAAQSPIVTTRTQSVSHQRGSFFCSQAVAEITWAVYQQLCIEPSFGPKMAQESPFFITFPSPLFSNINNLIQNGLSLPSPFSPQETSPESSNIDPDPTTILKRNEKNISPELEIDMGKNQKVGKQTPEKATQTESYEKKQSQQTLIHLPPQEPSIYLSQLTFDGIDELFNILFPSESVSNPSTTSVTIAPEDPTIVFKCYNSIGTIDNADRADKNEPVSEIAALKKDDQLSIQETLKSLGFEQLSTAHSIDQLSQGISQSNIDPVEVILNFVANDVFIQIKNDILTKICSFIGVEIENLILVINQVNDHFNNRGSNFEYNENQPQNDSNNNIKVEEKCDTNLILSQKLALVNKIIAEKFPKEDQNQNFPLITKAFLDTITRSTLLHNPIVPDQSKLDEYNTNVFGYVSPSDFAPIGSGKGDKNDENGENVQVIFSFW